MQITLIGSTDLPELLPLVRAYCDFYQVRPSDRELLELPRALLADPEREGLQLLAATTPARLSASPPCTGLADAGCRARRRHERPVRSRRGTRHRVAEGADRRPPGALS